MADPVNTFQLMLVLHGEEPHDLLAVQKQILDAIHGGLDVRIVKMELRGTTDRG